MILDANISGDTKGHAPEQAHVGRILRFGLKDLCMECILMSNIGELILHFY